ncbi:excinuclease ABC subunit A [Candidatus Daviesbacteria bacterium RIFCSPLOWO2_02_FULL_41_8]|uniref:UvrABC system protein A n=3 Tax=Candidatus Daviesiibacteriota TaxID=1752718 RepID=A0A1F5NLU2_9BACT|nr:MAG: excinuclease ABC subunit A [Candidatus Daviesbacteria bacterium RIFCSPHIGHO2_01_FULL_41_23]OGE33653.1 MAG: excinuclease ABC subunit A [Candidatus Daviesbacteria bacterium RIFCSPHIGHO2_02_FULL_41_10]OGE61906.1 MAG: excinuclease ABC subunit A [Candidatus Daviesbacteria bacterium RIFCSPLOWO2_01_FULL_41_32]OGE78651.1 MAG: excinuclease ABC subunit A [Candidatus Daviesbacteria bacterium RIFCSPLOWO2_02_FULL_41_8]
MAIDKIIIKGAREHNLKNIDLEIPKNQLVVLTGISGSGKSSLAFDTLYAEGQRRYVESLSSYARQFLGVMDKPDVDLIEGLSPAISIDQKGVSHNPRSTVGTTTEIYDYLRLLFARVGHPHCSICGREVSKMSVEQIAERVASGKSLESSKKGKRVMILAPVVKDRKGEYSQLFEDFRKKGFSKARIDGHVRDLSDDLVLIKTNKHTIDLVVDRLVLDKSVIASEAKQSSLESKIATSPSAPRNDKSNNSAQEYNLYSRLAQSIETALKFGEGSVIVSEVLDASLEFPQNPKKMEDHLYSERFACPVDNISLPEIEPRLLSFNSPHGACSGCAGLGTLLEIDEKAILNPILSIEEGGILPWSKLATIDTWFTRLIEAVGKEYGFNLSTRLGDLTPETRQVLLSGAGDKQFKVEGRNRQGKMTHFYSGFEGLVANLKQRYQETESDFVKAEIEKYMFKETCPKCKGARLKDEALSITIEGSNIAEVTGQSIVQTLDWMTHLRGERKNSAGSHPEGVLSDRELQIASPVLKEIVSRLQFLIDVGLDYLTLDRAAMTLAGGESQRIRLASQIGSGLSGVLYVLDEPSIGLHQRDNTRLIETLKRLRDLGNTVIVNEHDTETMESADLLIEIGPGAGEHGGNVVFMGTPDEIKKSSTSLTGQYLSGRKKVTVISHPVLEDRQVASSVYTGSINNIDIDSRPSGNDNRGFLKILGASQHNLKNINVSFPLGKFIAITGVSGSGKSTLIHDILFKALAQKIYRSREKAGVYKGMEGVEYLDKVVLVDQSPIGRTPRSNPATYTGAFTFIRELFSESPEAKIRGYGPGRFSFNVKGGRCEVCEGEGTLKIEMQFLPDVYVTCEACNGARYNREALDIRFKDKNIAEVLNMTVEESLKFFENIPQIKNKLQVLNDVGLGYIRLGQPAPTLSGGEAQRIKLSSELSKRSTGRTMYILDEPTTGLHMADIERLLTILRKLVNFGNTVVIIEHNLDVIKNTDWVIDLGPEGGDKGGKVIAEGTPEQIVKVKASYTGQYLAKII